MYDLLADDPVLLLAVLLGIGSAVGAVHIRGVSLGPAAVLFAGLALSAADDRLVLPEAIGVFGLAVFAYCIGVAAGPGIATALRDGGNVMALVAATTLAAAALTLVLGRLAGLDGGMIAGTYAGALTNTPALAAAVERLGSDEPIVAYSLTYVGGVLGMLAAALWAQRLGRSRPRAEDRAVPSELTSVTVRVTRRDLPTIAELERMRSQQLRFSRVQRGAGSVAADPDLILAPGDLAVLVGPADALAEFGAWLGHEAEDHLPDDRRELDMRRITIADPHLSGQRVSQLGLERFDAVLTRVRRGDVDMLATPDLVVQTGDRVRVVATPPRLREVSSYLGDSERGAGDINPVGLGIGLALGLAAGQVSVPTPIGALSLGSAAGPLLVGMLLGHLGRTGPISWRLPWSASASLQQVGVLVFLAYAGARGGASLVEALRSPTSLVVVGLGLVITVLTAGVVLAVARRWGLSGIRISGVLAGTQTQPAVLAAARDRTTDERVMVGYAVAVPVAMVVKIAAAQVLAILWGARSFSRAGDRGRRGRRLPPA